MLIFHQMHRTILIQMFRQILTILLKQMYLHDALNSPVEEDMTRNTRPASNEDDMPRSVLLPSNEDDIPQSSLLPSDEEDIPQSSLPLL